MKTVASSRRRHVALVGAFVAALGLSACSVTSPQTTMLNYAPADGVEMSGESLEARDILLVSHGNGAPAVLSGTLVNTGTEPLTVAVSVAGQPVGEVTVEPQSTARLDGVGADGSAGERTKVEALETPAGVHVEVRLQASGETLAANAPVLLPQGPYADFADDAGGTVEPPAQEEADH